MASPSAIGRRAPDGWAEAAARRVLWVGAEGSIEAARSPSPERQPKRGRLDAGGAPGESWRICAVRSPGQAADQHCAAAPAAPAPVAARPAAGTLVSRPDIAAALAELEALAAHYLAEDARLLADDKAALPPSTEASAAADADAYSLCQDLERLARRCCGADARLGSEQSLAAYLDWLYQRAREAAHWQDKMPGSSDSEATAARGVTTYHGLVHVRAPPSAADMRSPNAWPGARAQAVLWGVAQLERACLRADACTPAAAAPEASGAPPAESAPRLTADVLEAASILATMPKRGAPPASPVPGAAPMALGAAAAAGAQPAAPAAQAPGDKVKRARSRAPSPGTHDEAAAAAVASAKRSAPRDLPAWGAKARRSRRS